MKNRKNIKRIDIQLRTATAGLFLIGMLGACAPPPSADSGLSKELALLKQQQLQQQQTLQFIQQQLAQLQSKTGAETPAAVAQSTEQPIAGVDPIQGAVPLSPEALEVEDLVAAASNYLEAFSALSMGHYEQAQNGFSSFLEKYVDHRYAPNARYWLAETEIALNQLKPAEENLLQVANNPSSEKKAPAALARLAQLYQQQNLTEQAEDILNQLRTRFPESREAQLN